MRLEVEVKISLPYADASQKIYDIAKTGAGPEVLQILHFRGTSGVLSAL